MRCPSKEELLSQLNHVLVSNKKIERPSGFSWLYSLAAKKTLIDELKEIHDKLNDDQKSISVEHTDAYKKILVTCLSYSSLIRIYNAEHFKDLKLSDLEVLFAKAFRDSDEKFTLDNKEDLKGFYDLSQACYVKDLKANDVSFSLPANIKTQRTRSVVDPNEYRRRQRRAASYAASEAGDYVRSPSRDPRSFPQQRTRHARKAIDRYNEIKRMQSQVLSQKIHDDLDQYTRDMAHNELKPMTNYALFGRYYAVFKVIKDMGDQQRKARIVESDWYQDLFIDLVKKGAKDSRKKHKLDKFLKDDTCFAKEHRQAISDQLKAFKGKYRYVIPADFYSKEQAEFIAMIAAVVKKMLDLKDLKCSLIIFTAQLEGKVKTFLSEQVEEKFIDTSDQESELCGSPVADRSALFKTSFKDRGEGSPSDEDEKDKDDEDVVSSVNGL